ncbi:MAG: PAS domain-containing protein [Fimbriimonas sp.]
MVSKAPEEPPAGGSPRDEVLWALEATTDNVILLDREFRITFINRATANLNGITFEDVRGRTIWEVWPGNVGTDIERNYRKAMAEGVPVRFIHGYFEPGKFDLWLEIHAFPSPDGLAIFFHDVSDVKRESWTSPGEGRFCA